MITKAQFKTSLFSLLILVLGLCTPLIAEIQKIESFGEIQPLLRELDAGALVVLDIDEVTITDQDAILRPEGDPLKFKIFNEYFRNARTKKEKDEVLKILTLPLVLAEKKLVEKEIPQIIDQLQKRKIKVIALTSCPTKAFGAVEDSEKWRLDHLESFGIHFERSFPCLQRFCLNEMGLEGIASPIYNKGVLFTEGFSKADVLLSFIRKMNLKPTQVVFVDDMYRNIKEMNSKLSYKRIPHYEFHYERVEKVEPSSLNERVARFQFKYLFEHQTWLNDRQAQDLLYQMSQSTTDREGRSGKFEQ